MTEMEARAAQARSLRFKKPICTTLNWDQIQSDLVVIQDECYEAIYMSEDDQELIDAFGDENAYEYRTAFMDLAADCDRLQEQMSDYMRLQYDDFEWYEAFDLLFPAVKYNDNYEGYDLIESDYFPIDSYEIELARDAAKKKLIRITKDKLLDMVGLSLETVRQYMGIKYRYDCLKGAIDILRGRNGSILNAIKAINEAYEEASKNTYDFKYDFSTRLDRIISGLPDEIWLM